MIAHFFQKPHVIARLQDGPLGNHLEELATLLHEQGYTRNIIRAYLRHCEKFGQWLSQNGYSVAEANETTHDVYIRSLESPTTGKRPTSPSGVQHLLRLLRDKDGSESPAPVVLTSEADQWLLHYEHYLKQVLGATPNTCLSYLPMAKRFLNTFFATGSVCWEDISAQEVADFVSRQAEPRKGQGRIMPAAAIRAFLRFLIFSGVLQPGFEAAIAMPRPIAQATVPKRLTTEEVEQVLGTCAHDTPTHLRNRAILLLLARLGLRASEVFNLHLEDIDWHQGHLMLRPGKTHQARILPLSDEVGRALAGYLTKGRPVSTSRAVFLHCQAPFTPFARAGTICLIARRALLRAGVAEGSLIGSHTFRRTAASQMVNRGISFKEVADVLGHQSLQTTGIYAKLDLDVLALIALPWMGDTQ